MFRLLGPGRAPELRFALCPLLVWGRTARIEALSKDLEGLSLKRKACLLLQQINPTERRGYQSRNISNHWLGETWCSGDYRLWKAPRKHP